MVCIVNYNDLNEVVGCTREDGVSGGLEFLQDCEDLELEIVYKTQTELDDIALAKTKEVNNNNIYSQIDILEKSLLRPLREYSLDNSNQAALDKITQVEADIVALRDGLV